MADGAGGLATEMESLAISRALDMTRRDTALNVGEELLKSGESVGKGVEVRDWRFVGEGSVAGKSPRGCWRVDTIVRF